jgi:hypothetical protein
MDVRTIFAKEDDGFVPYCCRLLGVGCVHQNDCRPYGIRLYSLLLVEKRMESLLLFCRRFSRNGSHDSERDADLSGIEVPGSLGNAWITKILHHSGAKTIKINWDGRSHWEFSSPVCYVQPLAPFSSWMVRRAKEDSTVAVRVNPMFGERDWINAYRDSKPDAKRWGLQLWENVLLFFFSPSWPDGNQDEWDGWLSHHSRWMWCSLVGFILVVNFRDFMQRRIVMLPLAITVLTLFLMFQNLVTMEGRYRKPLEPFVALNLVYLLVGGVRYQSPSRSNSMLDDAEQKAIQ